MRLSVGLVATLAALGAPALFAQETDDFDTRPRLEAALSNDTLQLRYLSSGSKVGAGKRSLVSGGFFLSEERDTVLSGGLLFPADLNFGPLDMLFGPRVYAALLEEENDDVFSATLGAQARFVLIRRLGLAIVGDAYYGPDILTFGSGDSLTDFSARAEMRVGPKLLVFGGMRWFEFDLTEGAGERTLQDELFVGVGYTF